MWLRRDLQTKPLCLKRVDKWAAEDTRIMTESQVQVLEAANEDEKVHEHDKGRIFRPLTSLFGRF